MRTKRSLESQDFRKTRTSGHLYAALAMQAGEPMDVGPTVVVKDYPAADDQMGVINQGVLKNEKCKELQKWDKWDQELGLVAFNAQTPPDARGEVGLKHHEVIRNSGPVSRTASSTWLRTNSSTSRPRKSRAGSCLKPYCVQERALLQRG